MLQRILITLFVIFTLAEPSQCQANDWFHGITDSVQLFGSGIISDQYGNRDMAIAPDGNELMYTMQYKNGTFSTILCSKKVHGRWSLPEIAQFSGRFNDLEPAYSPDGKRIYFASNRPLDHSLKTKDYDIWYAMKNKIGEWTDPIRLDTMVNSGKSEFYPSVSNTGSIYFTREMEGKDEDIVMCKWSLDHFESAVSLPETINTIGAEFNAYVDPAETLILYTAYKRSCNIGSGDIYISFKATDGSWLPSKNLGSSINDKGLTYCPYLSPDKKYFFFTSNRWSPPPFNEKQNIHLLKKKLASPMNGWDNIYCIRAQSILSLKE